MLSFHSSDKNKKNYTANQIIDFLESDLSIEDQTLNFSKDYDTRHHNTYLLQAIAWNRKNAALKLIDLDKNKTSLDIKDEWPTCKNSPIVLAAKINDVDIVEKLILAGANVNKRDYRGFTALHYACLYRNEKMIKQLLCANAKLNLTDAFGKQPIDYYFMEISENDLRYRYGHENGRLNHVPDTNNRYFSTFKKCLSGIRWYIMHIIINNDLGKSHMIGPNSLYDYAKYQLQMRKFIFAVNFYEAMMKCFVDNRPKINTQLLQHLKPSHPNAYDFDDKEKYYLHPLDLVPSSTIQRKDGQTWIELREMEKPRYK